MVRLRLAVAVAAALALGASIPARADDAPLGERLVDVMVKLFGDHPGLRANHAKGIVAEGTFTASGAGEALTTATLFKTGDPVPLTARFSDATGVPEIPDGASAANPHGFAIRFQPANGNEMDLVANSLKIFPVATGEDFLALLEAIAASGPDAPKPTPVEQFAAAHPTVAAAGAGVGTPSSFGRETYNGINAFVFVDAGGNRHPFRFRITPVAGEEHLSPEEAAKRPPDFLSEDLKAQLAKGPVSFRLRAQMAGPGDDTANPSVAWPEDREFVDLGQIDLTAPAADNAAAAKELMLLPGTLPDGVEPSDDPMIDVRNESYAVSFTRRTQ